MTASGPPRDAAYSAMQLKNGVSERFATGKLNVAELYVQGVPIEEYIYHVVNEFVPREMASLPAEPRALEEPRVVTRDLALGSSAPPVAAATSVEFAEVAARAAHAHMADVTHAYHDPSNARLGYVLTSDENGQGSWQALPPGGDVEGPLQSRLNSVAVFDTTTGRLLRDSTVSIHGDALHVKTLVLEDDPAPAGSVATKGQKGVLEWKDQNSLAIVRQLAAQIKDLETQLKTLRTTLDSVALQATPVAVAKSLAQPETQAPTASLMLDPATVTVPDLIPEHSVLVTTAVPGQVQWQQPRWIAWKADSVEVPYCVPTWVDGHLVPSEVQIQSQNCLNCEVVQAHTALLDEAHVVTAVTRDTTAKNIVAEEITAQRLSVLGLALPHDDVRPGMVWTAANENGEGQWTEPKPILPPPGVTTPAVTSRNGLALFSDESGRMLDCSQLAVEGTMLRTVSSILLGWDMVTLQLTLGADATRVALGAGALQEASPNIQNVVALGCHALRHVQVGETVAVGCGSLAHLTTGQGNAAYGQDCLYENTEGHQNAGFGHSTLRLVQSNGNAAFGAGAMAGLIDGGHNSGVGAGCGDRLVKGRNNAMLGYMAGPAGDFSNCVCLGAGAQGLANGDLALGSREAPLRLASVATSGALPGLNPSAYVCTTVNGTAYKLALYDA